MRNSGKLFPYPVLSYESDDILNSKLEFKYNVIEDKDLRCKVEVKLKNKTLRALLKEGKVAYLILVECPKTRFRKAFRFETNEYEFKVSEKELQNRVEVASMIISKEDFDYRNDDFSEDYMGDSFYIKKNNILAYGEDISFNIERNTDNLENLPSIFLIVVNNEKNAESISINLEGDKIKILLKPSIYDLYKELYQDPSQIEILSSLIVVPALVEVIASFKNLEDDYGSTSWYQSINRRLKELKINKEEASDTALSTAQRILEDTFETALETLIKGLIEEEEEC